MKKKTKKNKLDKIFKPKSFLFIFNILVVVAIFFMFFSWLGVKLTYNKDKIFGPINQSSTVQKGTVRYVDSGDIPYLIKEDASGNVVDEFKIMSTSDLHFHDVNTSLTLNVLEAFIDKETPDLVVLDGDIIFWTRNTTWAEKLVDMFEEKQQYWTFVLGNHDHTRWRSNMSEWQARKKAFDVLTGFDRDGKIADHCLARCPIIDGDLSKLGCGTNCINIMGSTGLLQSLFFFDCNAINKVNNDVLSWFDDKVDQIVGQYDSMPETMLFSHIPFVEFPKYMNLIGKDDDVKYEFGKAYEGINCWGAKENGLFDKLLNLGNKVSCVFGHDHTNNICITYKNVRMMYTLALPYNTYNTRFLHPISWVNNCAYALDTSLAQYLDGVSEFIIRNNNPITICPKYSQFEHVLDNNQGLLYFQTCFAITYNAYPLSITLYVLIPLVLGGNITYFIFAGKYNKKRINTKKTVK